MSSYNSSVYKHRVTQPSPGHERGDECRCGPEEWRWGLGVVSWFGSFLFLPCLDLFSLFILIFAVAKNEIPPCTHTYCTYKRTSQPQSMQSKWYHLGNFSIHDTMNERHSEDRRSNTADGNIQTRDTNNSSRLLVARHRGRTQHLRLLISPDLRFPPGILLQTTFSFSRASGNSLDHSD